MRRCPGQRASNPGTAGLGGFGWGSALRRRAHARWPETWRWSPFGRYRFATMEPRMHRYPRVQRHHRGRPEHWLRQSSAGVLALCLGGCLAGHTAEVQRSKLPPLPDPITRHQNRVVIQLSPETVPESQCVAYEQYQTLCFDGVRTAIE